MILKFLAAIWAEIESAFGTKKGITALRRIIVFAAICSIPLFFMLRGMQGRSAVADHDKAGPESNLPTYRVVLPEKIRPLPEGVSAKGATPGFKFRGIKGWAWVPAQYLAEIPVMGKYKMNFL
jgi:hypothetical protein